ncbi:MAG: hypothetical protein RLZZ272_609 [Actinomycetota bacterium]
MPDPTPARAGAAAARLEAALATISDWPVPHAGAVAVDAGGTLARAGDVGTPRPVASVTKPVVAWATLVAVADGRLRLDDPAGPTAGQGATVRHLLAHAAGLDLDAAGTPIAPGRRRRYSNHGYEVVGDLLARRSGRPLPEVVGATVLGPLGMEGAELVGSAASGLVASVDDLARFARELLAPTLLPRALAHQACSIAFPGLDGVLPGLGPQRPNDWGLGPELRGTKDPHWSSSRLSPSTVGHFGRSGATLWADPTRGVGLVTSSGRDFGDWALTAWPLLDDAVLDALDAVDA